MPPDAVRTELDRICASRTFVKSDRMIRFLRFVVEETLSGRQDGLKEAVIGFRVFDREASYNPAADPVVRVEARRLRSKLADYYRGEGASDPIILDLPKGGYAPVMRVAPQNRAAPSMKSRWLAASATAILGFATASWLMVNGEVPWAREPNSVAVLPIADLSAKKDLDYFCDGLTEQLIFNLSHIDGLRVPGRTSSFQFKERAGDLHSIGKALGVRHLLDGSVRSDGNRLRITLQLVKVEDGYPLWSHTYERELDDVLALQDEIGSAVVNALRVRVAGRLPSRRFSEKADCQRLYFQARRHFFEGDFPQTISLLEQAIDKDPTFALAWAVMARAYTRLEAISHKPDGESFPRSRMAASRALEIDGSLVDAAIASAIIEVYEWNWPGAEREFRRALTIDSRSAEAHGEYAIGYLAAMGRLDEAVNETAKSVELEPLGIEENNRHGNLLRWAKRDVEAIAQLRRALEISPQSAVARTNLGRAYLQARMFDRALEHFRGNELWTAIALAMSGRQEEALRVRMTRPLTPLNKAAYNLAMGDKDGAFTQLALALDERTPGLVQIASDPYWEPLRSDQRYRDLLKRIGVPIR